MEFPKWLKSTLGAKNRAALFRVNLPAFPLVFHFSAPLQRLVEVLQLLCLCSKATDSASKNTVTLTYPLILPGSSSKGLCNVKWPRKKSGMTSIDVMPTTTKQLQVKKLKVESSKKAHCLKV